MKQSVAFLRGRRAGFGQEKFDPEEYSLNKAYRAGYHWAKKQIRDKKKPG